MKTGILYVMLLISSALFAQTQIYNGVPNARGLTVDDTYVYTMAGSTLYKINHTQSNPTLETVATGFDNTPSNNIGFTGLNLAQVGSNILIPGGVTNKVGFASTIVGANSSKLNIVDASYVVFYYNNTEYFITRQGSFTSGAYIRKFDNINGSTVNTSIVTTLPTAYTRISDATMDGDILYYVDRGGNNNIGAIYKVDLSQANPTAQLVKGNITSISGIHYTQDYLYFTRPTASGGILKIKADGTGSITAVGNSIPYARGIDIIGRDIYVVNSLSPSSVYKYSDPMIQACDVPTNIMASGITNNSATISWDMNSVSTSYDLVYVDSGQPIASGTTISNITTNSTVLTGIITGQSYDVYIKAYCSGLGTDSGYSDAKTFLMASPIYVDTDATGINKGTSWTDAFTDLETALDVVASGAEIWTADGTYIPSTSNVDTRQARFTLPNGVKLYGGFNGAETQLSQRDSKTNTTILSGDLNGDDNTNILDTESTRQDNSYHVIVIEGNTRDIVVDGFTIANANSTVSERAAIFTNPQVTGDEITATFRNCIIEKNTGSYTAGYWSDMPNITTVSSDVDFESCIVRNNFSRNQNTFLVSTGNRKARGSVINSLFYNNTSLSRASCIYFYSDDFDIINSTFANNTGSNGNVISIFSGGTVGTIDNTIIYGNGSTTPLELVNGVPSGVIVNNSIIEGGQLGTTDTNPLFVDAVNDDFTLQSTSLAINVGSNSNNTLLDLDGNPRVIDGIIDLGAYEYKSGAILRNLVINTTGDGSVTPVNGSVYNEGVVATLTATPDAGYQFDGWGGDATGTTNPLSITMDADKTVTAIFSATQRTLTINATNGVVATNPNPTNGTYDDGTSVVLTATPTVGYQFDGWSGDATGTTNPLSITMDADKTVTAIFSATQRTLTINATNGVVATNPNPTNGTYDDGTSVILTATPDAGYQFDGWSGDATGITNPLSITMDADKIVTAIFSTIQRALTVNATNGSVTTNPNPTNGTYDDGTSVILTASPDVGYQFDGWSGDATGITNPLSITMDADKIVTAIFSIIQRTLTVNATNGIVTTNPTPTNGTYDEGTSVVLTATPDTGYQFDGWSGDATGTTNPLTIIMDADKTITAVFSDSTLGINDNDKLLNFVMYPNPSSKYLNIQTDEQIEEIAIYTLLGTKVNHSVENAKRIDISDLSNGVYFINVKTPKGSSIKRFIKS